MCVTICFGLCVDDGKPFNGTELTSLANALASDRMAFCVRGRRRCSTALRMCNARAMTGPNNKL